MAVLLLCYMSFALSPVPLCLCCPRLEVLWIPPAALVAELLVDDIT